MRMAAQLEYDGSAYCGWQKQQGGIKTLQETVEKAFSQVANEPLVVQCAGRTDTGVHALGQVIHFDTQAKRDAQRWMMGANYFLPADIRVVSAQAVDEDFHARFSAQARHYQYDIYNRRMASALYRTQHTWFPKPLDETLMQTAGQYLIGEHDFSSYRASACQSHTPYRQVTALNVTRQGYVVSIRISANAFLHHMVRNITGVLLDIGVGDQAPIWAQDVLHKKDRTQASVTAPPTGLKLMKVDYPAPWLFQ